MVEREFKTQLQQWSAILDFGEEHPSIFRPQFKHGDGDALQNAKLWEELAGKLNSMGFGSRSVEKWKMAIGRWKSKTKSKAAQLRIEAEKTGGGGVAAIPLSPTEERLMNLMGWRSVRGDGNVELGMERVGSKSIQVATLPAPCAQPSTSAGSNSSKSPPPLAEIRQPARKRSRLSTDKSRKFVSVARMQQETMEEKRKMREVATRQAEALEAISQTLRDFTKDYKNKNM